VRGGYSALTLPPLVANSEGVNRMDAAHTYTVIDGDTISGISQKLGVLAAVIIRLNNIQNPNLIYIGQSLLLPPPAQPATSAEALPPRIAEISGYRTHTVVAEEWIYKIARAYDVHPNDIIAANPAIDPHRIYPGQELQIPQQSSRKV